MQKMIIAILLLGVTGCGEEPEPPRRTKAPERPSVEKKPEKKTESPSAMPAEKPKPAETEEKPKAPPSPVPKVLLDAALPEWSQTAPNQFKVKFATGKGDFTVEVHRDWAPRGADRFYCLVKNGYYDGVRFFRVVAGFMVQFGIHAAPEVNAVWKNATFPDDPVVEKNVRGTISFATRGANSRTTQIFINFADKNVRLDGMGFAPFAQVVEGMDVVDKIYDGYGERPNQQRIQAEGNEYLNADFPNLDFVKSARILP